ncbi:hypothetical protein ACLQ3C_13870 [Gordonia sp. DT30]|uniref:hypothetical protein n=1 Tax=Gordonia sp. DT30 TaxID=3416546 RepID=UPI003CE8A7C8
MTDAQAVPELTADERTELEHLRARVAELTEAAQARDDDAAPPAARPRRRISGRAVGVVLLVILCAVLTLLSVTTRYVRSQILDTDHYVATVAPLAADPAVQQQVTTTIVDAINAQVDVQQITTDALTNLTELTPADRPRADQAIIGLAPVLAGQAEGFIHGTVAQFVASPQFQDIWTTANREAHEAVVAAVTGETRHGAVEVDTTSGTISIQLGPVITQVKQRLLAHGFAFADRIPVINKAFVIWHSPQLARAQHLVKALDKVANVLPWLAILAIVAAVGVARSGRRWRTLAVAGVAVVIAMLLLAIAILVGRMIYLDNVPADVLSPGAAQAIFDTVIAPMRLALRAVAVVGLVLALVGYFAGGSGSARAVRSRVGRGFAAIDARRADRDPSTVEKVLWQARFPLRIAVPTVAAFLLMFWHYPTGWVVFWIVLIGALVLVAIEFTIAPARRQTVWEAP